MTTTAVARALASLRAAGFNITEYPVHRAAIEMAFDNRLPGHAGVFGVVRVGVRTGRFVGGTVVEYRNGTPRERALRSLADVRQLARVTP